MASVISGSYLGLYGNSLGASPGASTGRPGQSNTFYINSATGNLVVQAQDEYLASLGLDLSLVRTYNSQGAIDGDNNDGWRLGLYRRLVGLTGAVNTAGSTITKIYGDGAEAVFTFDTGRGLYVSSVGEGAHDTLSFNSGAAEWTFGDGNTPSSREIYNSSGQLVRLLDADGNATTFTYTGSLITQITDASGQSTFLDYTGTNLSQIRVVVSGVTQTLTRYTYDTSNRLTHVTLDLSPDDNVIADGNTYITTYTYDGTSTRITSITQGDTSTVAFTYEQVGSIWKVKTLTDGEGKITTFTYTETIGTETYNLNSAPLSPWGAAMTLESASGAAASAQVRFDDNADGFALWIQSNNVLVSRYAKSTNTWAPAQTIDTSASAITVPHLYVDAGGNAIASWIQSNGTANSVYASLYSVGTNTWSAATTIESIDSIAVNPIGTINAAGEAAVVFRQPAAATTTPNNLYVARFTGGAWVAPELVETRTNDITTVPGIALDAQGNVQVLFLQSDGTANSIYTNRYTASTNTWSGASLLEASNTAALTPQIGFDQNGDGVAMWTTSADVIVRRYTKSTNTWESALTRDTRANAVTVPELTVHASGNAILTWIQSDGSANSVWTSRYSVATNTWSTALAVDNLTTIAAHPAASINAAGDAIVTWRQPVLGTTTPNNLYASLYTVASNTWSTPESIESRTNDITTAPSVALDNQGNAQVAFIQSDGAANSVYTNRYSAGQKVSYLIPSGATWASIASALYGNANAADELQAAVGNPPLTAGNRLSNLPASLISTTRTRVDVTDPLNQVTTYENNAEGRLIKVASPAVGGVRLETLYTYDPQGNLTQVIDAKDNATVMQYDTKGNLTLTRDVLGNTVTRTYSTSNQLITETAYLAPDADGAGSGQPASPLTTRFAYDSENHLRFVVSPAGRVSEHRYAANGTRTASIVYASGTYTIGSTALTETQLNTWVGTQDRTKTERTDYVYDFRGQLSTATTYTTTHSSGVGTGTVSTTRYLYDQRGRLLQTVDGRGEATVGDPNDYLTSYTYDGLGRLLTTNQWVSAGTTRTTTTTYDDANNRVVTSLQNGLATTSVFDRRGLLVSVAQANSAQALGTTTYKYDAAGQLRLTIDPIGNNTHVLYDEAGRVIGSIDATGNLTELIYDKLGNAIKTIRYANRATGTQLTSLIDGSGNPANVTLASLRPALDANNDRVTRSVYDNANRAVMLLVSHDTDATQAYVTQNSYDGAGRITDVIVYTNAISVTGLSDTTIPADVTARITTATTDRRTRYFYDNEGRTIGTLDAEGYLTESIYNAASHLTSTLAYATATQVSLRASGTFAQLRTSAGTNSNDQRTYTFYNAKGEVLATLDQEGYFSEYQYDLTGNQTQSVRYYNKGATYTGTQTIAQLRPTAHPNDQVVITIYNGTNQVIQVTTNPQGTVTTFAYNSVGNLIETHRAWNTSDVRTTRARYDAKGHVLQELTGEGSLALDNLLATNPAATQAEIDALWNNYSLTHSYDVAARRTSTTDQNGNKTLFYYDEAGRLSYTVNTLGEVAALLYNSFGDVIDRIRYIGRISTSGLTGGIITADLLTRITAIAQASGDSADSHSHYHYTLRGAVKQAIEAPDNTSVSRATSYTYNAFGEAATQQTQLTDILNRTDSYSYDKRGLLTQTTDDQGTLNRLTSKQYDAFGRITQTTDGRGIIRTYGYDRLGRELTVTTDQAGLNLQTQTTYDSFNRVLTQQDARGNTTTFSYNDTTRSFTVTTSEGIVVTTQTNTHGETVSVTDGRGILTTYTYDKNGQLKTEIEDAGAGHLNLTSQQSYDRANRLIETTDANGTITTFTYDAANRLLTKALDPTGLNLQSTYTYDGQGRTLTVTEGANTLDATVTQSTYDAKGRIKSVSIDPTGRNLTTAYTYDRADRAITVTQGAGTPEASSVQYLYDNLNRRIESIKDPGGLNIRCVYTYDQNDNATSKTQAAGTAEAQTTRYVYDTANRLTYTVNALGGVTQNSYDNNGSIVQTTHYANPISLAGLSTTITQADITSRLAPNTTPEQTTRYAYDRDNRLVFTVDALQGLTETRYDNANQLTKRIHYATALPLGTAITRAAIEAAIPALINAADQETRHTYDAAGRLTEVINAFGTTVQVTETYAYDNAGNQLRHTNGRGHIEYSAYDSAHREIRHIDAMGYVVDLSYDSQGNTVSKTTYLNALAPPVTVDDKWAYTGHAPNPTPNTDPTSGDRTTSYAYDKAGRLTTETAPSINGLPGVITRYTCDARGNVTDKTEAQGLPEERTTHSLYDKLDRLIEQTTAYGAPEAAISRFTYDTNGNQVTIIDPRGIELAEKDTPWAQVERQRLGYSQSATNLTEPQRAALKTLYTTTQVFDQLNRKTAAIDPMGGRTDTQYDSFGNITKVTDPNRNSGYFYYDQLNHTTLQVDAEGYASETIYDLFGNSKETIKYATQVQGTYNETTKPTIVIDTQKDQHTKADYDQLNRTIKITDAENYFETFIYDAQGNVTTHVDKNNNTFTYEYDKNNNKIADHLPITSAKAQNQQVQIVNRFEYDAVGNKTKYTEASGLPEERVTQYVYDKNNRVVETIEPNVLVGVEAVSVGGNLAMGGGTANYAISQTTPGGLQFYSNAQVSWPPIIGYGDGNIKVVWNTGISSLGERTGFVDSQATSITITGHNGEVTNNILGPGDFYEVSIYKQTSNGDVLITRTTGEYAFPNLLLGYRLLGTFSASSEAPNLLHFTGQPTAGSTLRLAYWPSSDSDNITQLDLASYAPGTFSGMTSTVLSGGYGYEATVFDSQGAVLNRFSGTFSVTGSTVITTVQGIPLTTGQLQTPHTYKSYDTRGNLIKETDAKGDSTSYYYDANSSKIARVDAERYLHRYFYDAAGNLITERTHDQAIPATVSLEILPDPYAIAGMDASKYRETTHRYDANNRLGESRTQAVFVYDHVNGLRTQTLTTTQSYDRNGNVVLSTDANGNRTYSYYDKVGNKILQVDALGYVIAWDYDANGNLTRETQHTNALNAATLVAISTNSDPLVLKQAVAGNSEDRITEYGYDRMNRVTVQTVVGLSYATISTNGVLSEQTANVTTQHLYDGEGNRTALIQADGSRSDYTYDALKRLIREQGAAFSDFEETAVRATTETTYDGVGNVRTETRKGKTAAADQITRYEYDPHGNRIQEIDALDNPVYYFYDLNGNVTIQRTRRINPDGTQPSVDTKYTYDNLGRQVTTEDANNFVYHATYNAHGEIITKGLNGLTQEYFEYDLVGHLVKTNKDDGVDRAYFYDANGNETAKIQSAEQDTDLKPLSLGQIASLSSTLVQCTESEYDARNQLIKTYQAPIEFTASTFGSQHVWLDVLSDPFRGGTITPAKGGTANYAISQSTPDISHFYSNAQVSWPPIIGYGDGDIKVVWNTGISSLGERTGFVDSQATSITITGHNGEVTNNILGPGDFYEVSIYKQTSNGDVLITRTTGEYAFPNLLLGYRLLGTFSASSEAPNLLHFTGQRAEAESLQLWLWPVNGTKPATPISVPRLTNSSGNAVPGSFAFDWSSYINGDYNYEFKTLDSIGNELDYVSGTLTLVTNPAVNSKYIDTIQLVLTDDPSVTQNTIIRSQIHNAFGEVVTEVDGRDYTTNFTYNDLGQLVEKKDPETNATAENGAVTRVRPTTRYYYDAAGRLIGTRDPDQVLNPAAGASTQSYDASGNLLTEFNPFGDRKQYGYDVFGNKHYVVNETGERTDFTYDRSNQLIRIDRPTHASILSTNGTANAPRFETFVYDEGGRRIRYTNALGQSELTYYDDIGRVKRTVSLEGVSTSYRYIYDAASGGSTTITTLGDGKTLEDTKSYFGQLLSHEDLGGHTFSYQYNEAGWLIRQTGNTDSDPELDQDISFTYYHNGNLKEVIDAGINTRTKYQYDANGNRIFEGYYQGTGSVYYQWSHATYDELNRVNQINDPKYNVTYEYDVNGNRRHVYARYNDGLGNDVQRQDYWYTYDAMNRFLETKGRLSGTTTGTGGEPVWNRGSGTIEAGSDGYAITYNSAGQRASATYKAPDGTTLRETYVYAVDGLLERVETDQNINDPVPAYTSAQRYYDAVGNVKQYLELDSSGGITRNYQYTYTGDSKVLTENNGQFTSTSSYDAAGNLTSIVSPQSGGTTLTTSYAYEYWDSAKQKEIRLQASNQQASGWAPGFSRFTYDVNGHLTQVSDIAGNRHLSYKVDADGRILQRNELIGSTSSRTQRYYYLNGIGVGDAGGFGSSRQDYASLLAAREQAQGRRGQPVSSADFDYNFQPINDRYPATTPGSYVVRQGDTLQSVSLAVWGDASLWYLIADANGLDASTALIANQTLVIPNVVENTHNSAATHKIYNPGELIGDTNPTLPEPSLPPPPVSRGKKGCSVIGQIIVIIVTIVVAYYTGISLEGAGWSQGFAAAGGAAAGSVAGQLTGMALGIQDKFSWKAVAIASLTAGATKGLQVDKIGNVVIREATKNILSQGVSMLLGQQEKFSWTSLAVSAITAPNNEAIDKQFGSANNNLPNGAYVAGGIGREFNLTNLGKSLAGEFLKSATRSVTTIAVNGSGKLDWKAVTIDTLGNAVGNSIVGAMKYDQMQTRNAEARLDQFKGPDGKPLYQNGDQRAALIDLLKQDPTVTPEKLARAQDMAKLSNAVYLKDVKDSTQGLRDTVPDHYERVTNFGEGDLKGFKQSDFEKGEIGFSAGLFRDMRDGSYTLAYRGTDDAADWPNGNAQAFKPDAPQYKQAIDLATKLQDVLGDQLTDITGHSLGGGLSSAASIMTGIRATTFNAAGLNSETITSRGGTWNTERNESLITNYRVQDEVLTSLQERGSFGSLPLALLTPVIGPSAIALNAMAASLPNAAGRQTTINAFDQNNQSMSWAARNNPFQLQPVALHGMDYVMRGMLINDTKRP